MCPSVGSSAEVDLQALCSSYFSTPGMLPYIATYTHTQCHVIKWCVCFLTDEVNEDKPRLLYVLYFNVSLNSFHRDKATHIDGLPQNVYLTSDPSAAVSFEGAVEEAQSIFEQICPGEDFLPTPPDPSDIIYDQPTDNDPHDTADVQGTVDTTEPQDSADACDPADGPDLQETADATDSQDTADTTPTINQ